MKLFYVTSAEVLSQANFGYRSFDLKNGKFLVCVEWKDELSEMQWARKDGVIPLPHPILEQNFPLTDEHLSHLSSRFAVEKGDNIHHLIREVVKVEPLCRVWAV